MKAAILANRANSFYRPLAEGLDRLFKGIGVDRLLLYDGLEPLPRQQWNGAGQGANWKGRLFHLTQGGASWLSYQRLPRRLRSVDFAYHRGPHAP